MLKGIHLVGIILLKFFSIQSYGQSWITVWGENFNGLPLESHYDCGTGSSYWNNHGLPRNGLINGTWEVGYSTLGSTQIPNHSSGGRFLMFWSDNAGPSSIPSADSVVFQKTVPLVTGMTYRLSYKIGSFNTTNNANIIVYARTTSGSTVTTNVANPLKLANSTSWLSATPYEFIANGESVTFLWVNRTRVVNGNDFALDDLLIEARGWNVSGKVFHDATTTSVDGTPLQNISVRIVNNSGTALDTVTTNSLGEYTFQDLIPGTYTVEIILPDNYYNVSSTDATPLNGSTTVNVTSASISNINFGINDIIDPDDNSYTLRAGQTTGNILLNDSLNGLLVVPSSITATATIIPDGFTLNTDGTIEIADSVVSGTYTITYQICETGATPANCSTAIVTIHVENEIIANNNTFTTQAGTTTTTIFDNDSLNGVVVNVEDITATATIIPDGFTLNTDGTIEIADSVVSGTYTITYEICETGATPANCSTAIVTIHVENEIIANNDTFNTPRGSITTSILENDSLNGNMVNIENVEITVLSTLPTGIEINEDGTVIVGIEAANGTNAIDYRICEKSDVVLCSEATIFLTIENPLSIQIANLSGEAKEGFNQLEMEFIADEQLKEVILEKSLDGNTWSPIFVTNEIKEKNELINLSFIDRSLKQENLYYQYKLVDEEGKMIGQSNVINIINQIKLINIYPNPAKTYFNIDNLPSNSNITIVDNLGRQTMNINNQDKSNLLINTENLTDGIYYVIIQSDNKIINELKLVIKK